MPRNRTRASGADDLREVAQICLEVFGFLTTDFGYRVLRENVESRGFTVALGGDGVGVLVEFYVRDGLHTSVVLLDGGELPAPLGEMTPDSHVAQFHLRDVEAVSGVPSPPTTVFGIPSREDLEGEAARVRAAALPLLRGDLSMVPALQERVLDRARRYAIEKWGDRASEWGW